MRAVVEQRRDLHHYGKLEMASRDNIRVGAERAPDLNLDDLAVI